jgi:ABC-2 type transport system ATP-binding protein
MATIEVAGLTKHYGEVRANDDLSFSVEAGEVFGYLGPNGAGKTTTIRTLMGFQSPTSGTATVLGHDVREEAGLIEAKRSIGFLPGDPAFDETATGARILDLHESIKGGSRREELVEHFEPPLDRAVREYSRGNVQKLGLVQAFMHDPDLAILDEPTSGLDPLLQREFNEFVRAERETGTTVFMSSHVLSEVRRVCDRVGIIRDGRLVAVERVADLLDRGGKVVRLRAAGTVDPGAVDLEGVHDLAARHVDAGSDGPAARQVGAGSDDPAGTSAGATELSFTYTGGFDELVAFLGGLDLLELDVKEAPIEDVFRGFYTGAIDAGGEAGGIDGGGEAGAGEGGEGRDA